MSGTVDPGDPLAGFRPSAPASTTDPADPLAGWKPGASVAPATTPPATSSSGGTTTFLDKAWKRAAGAADARSDAVPYDPAPGMIGAGKAAYESVPENVTGTMAGRNVFTPEAQRTLETPGGWVPGRQYWGPALNVVGNVVGTGAADLAALGGGAIGAVNEGLIKLGVPASAVRDLNVAASQAPFAPELRSPRVQGFQPGPTARGYTEMATPPPATLSELLQRQRAAPTTDPVTASVIETLKRAQGGSDMPQPPAAFTPTQQPPPAGPPSGGLLGAGVTPPGAPPGGLLRPGPTPAAAEILTQQQLQARAKGYYSPSDEQAAQGALINGEHSDTLRQPLMDAVPTDPEKAGYTGDNSLIQLGRVAKANQGQPMSFDTALSLDKEMTARRQEAYRSGNYTLASQIEDAQDTIRQRMNSLPDSATTGDPATLANLDSARKSYSQSVKQGQLEDINYRASLLPEDKRDAYVRNQTKALLGNDRKTGNWSPDERAAAEEQVKSGNIGSLTSLGLSFIKPTMQLAGGTAGGSLFGPGGAIVGSQIAGGAGDIATARLRARLQQMTLDPVMRQITANAPPPPPGQ